MTLKRLVTLAALLLVTTMSAPVMSAPVMSAPASAESGAKRYHRGAAPPSIDIVRLHVDNAERRFTMRIEVRDLVRDRGTFTFYYWRGGDRTPPPRSLLVEVEQQDGEVAAVLHTCGREDCTPSPCAGVRAEWRTVADVVAVSAPQRCYPRRDGTPPPSVGRFYAGGSLGDHDDEGDGLLRLARG